jgi:hypothetical protein
VALCTHVAKKKRAKLYEKLRHLLRHEPHGVQRVIEELKKVVSTRQGKKMKKALAYFEKHLDHMSYAAFDEMKLPVGSGHMESAVRRVVNLRFKAPGSFWKEKNVEQLMHLRAYFKAGRWDELIKRVINREAAMPSFVPDKQKLRNSLHVIGNPKHNHTDQRKRAA